MLITVSTFDALVSAVRSEVLRAQEIHALSNRQVIVAIDGWPGAGKTCNARKIAHALHYDHVDLDDLVNEDECTILAHVRYKELDSALQSSSIPITFSGVCMQAVLDRAGGDLPVVLVYVQRMSCPGWADSHRIYPGDEQTVEEFWATESHSQLEREIAEYHHKYLPDRTSHIVFRRSSHIARPNS